MPLAFNENIYRDRTRALELGTRMPNLLIGLMGSVRFPNLKQRAGELLFACFGESVSEFVDYIG